MKAEDDPEVSHEPDAEIEPVVREMEFVPASFIVTPETTIEDAVPIRLPPPEIARLALPVMLFPDVVSLPVTDSVPRTSSAVFCVIVQETIVPLSAADWNVTSWNSSPARFAKVNVREEGESKITTPVPATQFVEVLLLDQEPANVQVPLPIRK